MEWTIHPGCRNCSYDCCCLCDNKNCHYCKKDIKLKSCEDYRRRCSELTYNKHYACFNCKIIKKTCHIYYKREEGQIDRTDEHLCAICRQKMLLVSNNLRFPKKTDIKRWNLIEKILMLKYPGIKNSLFGHINCHGIFETNHMDPEVRKLFSYPTNNSEFKEFEKKIKTNINYI